MSEEYLTLRMPSEDWNQILKNLQNYTGLSVDEIEILGDVTVVDE